MGGAMNGFKNCNDAVVIDDPPEQWIFRVADDGLRIAVQCDGVERLAITLDEARSLKGWLLRIVP